MNTAQKMDESTDLNEEDWYHPKLSAVPHVCGGGETCETTDRKTACYEQVTTTNDVWNVNNRCLSTVQKDDEVKKNYMALP